METAVQCEKNVLLATAILLTTAGSLFNEDDPLLERYVDELTGCLEVPLPSKVAAGCCRSILLNSRKGKAEAAMAAMLLPKVINFITRENDEDVEGIDESRRLCIHTLVAFVQSLDKSQVSPSMALIMPTLLQFANQEGSAVYRDIAARLLELASVDQATFRGIVSSMDPEVKSFMEEVLKALGGQEQKNTQEVEPTIALKMFGS